MEGTGRNGGWGVRLAEWVLAGGRGSAEGGRGLGGLEGDASDSSA